MRRRSNIIRSPFSPIGGGGGGGSYLGPNNTAAPVVSGTTEAGQTLTCTTGTWTGSGIITYAYQWQRDNVNIIGATANTHLLTPADENAIILCIVTATDDNGARSKKSNAVGPIVVPLPENTVLPVISGVAQVSETLTCSNGTWTVTGIPSYAYQWLRDSVNIVGETANTYQLQYVDLDTMITCQVTVTDDFGATSEVAAEVGPVESNNNAFSDPFRDPFQDTLLEFDPLFIIEGVE